MSIKIGHSSISETGRATGGKSGDQTEKEVCTRTWYDGNWTHILRPKNKELAEKSAKFVEDVCENKNVGYDQSGTGMTEGRNSLYQQAKLVGFDGSKISIPCESDCSSFMHTAAIAGGANMTYGSNGYTTRTMVKAFEKSGDYESLPDKKYLTSDKYLKRGDILVKEGSHTVMVLENGVNAYDVNQSASNTMLNTYTVVKGDTLSKIGSKTGIAWKTIAEINRITSPYIVYVGQVLKLKKDDYPSVPFNVKLKENLNIRDKANGKIVVTDGAKKNVIYTIVTVDGQWGKLKSGAGWICIKDEYVNIV